MNLSEAAADDMTAVAGHILQCVGGVPQLCLPALLVLSMCSRVRVRLCVCGREPVRVCAFCRGDRNIDRTRDYCSVLNFAHLYLPTHARTHACTGLHRNAGQRAPLLEHKSLRL